MAIFFIADTFPFGVPGLVAEMSVLDYIGKLEFRIKEKRI